MSSTQRPFFHNFLAAFRAHHAIKAPAAATTTSTTASTSASLSTSATNANTSTATAVAAAVAFSPQPRSASPEPATARSISSPQHKSSTLVSAFSPPSNSHHNHTSSHHARRSNRASNAPNGTRNQTFPTSTAGRRRGSDSSSDGGHGGFRDALGGEKWFIGGRTPLGEERFYRLTMARRERSIDRTSLDRMSL